MPQLVLVEYHVHLDIILVQVHVCNALPHVIHVRVPQAAWIVNRTFTSTMLIAHVFYYALLDTSTHQVFF